MAVNEGKQLKYFQLMEDLKEKILSGEIQAGDKLPSENELSGEYGISRQTVRKALQMLQSMGYIYAEHGRGTFCSELARHTHTSKNIAVVTTYLSDYIFPRVIAGIDSVLTSQGYSIILKNTRNSRSMEAKCLEELLQKDIDGVIIEPSKSQIFCKHTNLYDKLDEYNIPYVFIQGCFEQMIQTLGTEFDILRNVPSEDIKSCAGERIAEGIENVRTGNVKRIPGYDGEYGKIELFDEN
mgnify:CR=1 FL=1